MRAPSRCTCGHPLTLPDVPVGEHKDHQCPNCGEWWAAEGWHPTVPPHPATSGPWWAIREWPDVGGPYLLRYWIDVVDGRPSLVGAELWGRSPVYAPWPIPDRANRPTVPLRADATRLRVPELLENAAAHHVGLRVAVKKAWEDFAEADPALSGALARQKGLDESAPGDDAARQYTERTAVDETRKRKGRERTEPVVLDEVLRIYKEATAAGVSYAPRVVDHFRRQGRLITESTARTWKRKALQRKGTRS